MPDQGITDGSHQLQETRYDLKHAIQPDIYLLAERRAALLTGIKTGGEIPPSDFRGFYHQFYKVYSLTRYLLDDKIQKDIDDWIESVDTQDVHSVLGGISLSHDFHEQIVRLGLGLILEESQTPPFDLGDLDLDALTLDEEET